MTRDGSPERVPDWLLGGHVRRRVLERLTDKRGWTAAALAAEIDAGDATVFEVLRVLKPLGAVERVGARGTYRLSHDGLGSAIRTLVTAGSRFSHERVARPPGRVKNQGS